RARHPTPELELAVGEHRCHPCLRFCAGTERPQRPEEPLGEVPEPQSRRSHSRSAESKNPLSALGRRSTINSSRPKEYWRSWRSLGHQARGNSRSTTAEPSRGGRGMRLNAARKTLATPNSDTTSHVVPTRRTECRAKAATTA